MLNTVVPGNRGLAAVVAVTAKAIHLRAKRKI